MQIKMDFILLTKNTSLTNVFVRKLLWITVDSRLTFHAHLKQLCKKFANRLNALTKIVPYLRHNQRQHIYSSFFTGQLSYYSLIWIFCCKQSNHFLNKLQERALRIIHNNYESSFSGFLKMSSESAILIKNINALMAKIYEF